MVHSQYTMTSNLRTPIMFKIRNCGTKLSVFHDTRTLWLPAKVIHQATHSSYLVQVVGGRQYRCACDHICEHHPDAVKDDTFTTPVVAPATLRLCLCCLQQTQTLHANHLQFYHNCRCHPLEVHQSRPVQHPLPFT